MEGFPQSDSFAIWLPESSGLRYYKLSKEFFHGPYQVVVITNGIARTHIPVQM